MQQSFDRKNFIHLFVVVVLVVEKGISTGGRAGLGPSKIGWKFPQRCVWDTERERERESDLVQEGKAP